LFNLFKKNNVIKEARYAAGMNFDLENVEPFFKNLSSSVLDSGFSQDEINAINSEINKMKKNNEVKSIGTFEVMYKGQPTKIRIEAEIHMEDEDKEVVLYMYSIEDLVALIDEEMMKFEEEME